MTKMNLPALNEHEVDAGLDAHIEELERRVKSLEGELEEAKKLIQSQAARINQDLAMKMAIAKLLG